MIDITNMTEDELISYATRLMGQKHGAKGGKARWEGKTPQERTEKMRKIANERWDKVRAAKGQSNG